MSENLRVARLFMITVALFAVGRWVIGMRGVPYERGHHVFSLVILTLMASAFYGAFCRKWGGYTILRAVGLGVTLGVLAQLVIVLATALSYALHADTYFVNEATLGGKGVSFGRAMGVRLGGLIVNSLMAGIAGGLGWLMGAALPEPGRTR